MKKIAPITVIILFFLPVTYGEIREKVKHDHNGRSHMHLLPKTGINHTHNVLRSQKKNKKLYEQIININPLINNIKKPIEIFLEAGTYKIEVIGISKGGIGNAWNPWQSISCKKTRGCKNKLYSVEKECLNYKITENKGCVDYNTKVNTGWITSYTVQSNNISSVTINSSEKKPIHILPTIRGKDYFLITKFSKRYEVGSFFVYPTERDALLNSKKSIFILKNSDLVGFSINDEVLWDNQGKLSLKIEKKN